MSGSEGRDFLCRRVGQGRRRVGEQSGQGRAGQGRVVEAVLVVGVVVRTACWDQSGPHPAPPRTHTLTLLPGCLPSRLPRPAACSCPDTHVTPAATATPKPIPAPPPPYSWPPHTPVTAQSARTILILPSFSAPFPFLLQPCLSLPPLTSSVFPCPRARP